LGRSTATPRSRYGVAEDVGQAGQRLFLPASHLGGVDTEHLRDLGCRLVRFDNTTVHIGAVARRILAA